MRGDLEAVFVRTVGARDRVYVTRSNGTEVSWAFPTYGDGLPHDLVHLVVEAAYDVKLGFWGRVDAGVDPNAVNAEANRAGGKDKYAAFGADLEDLMLAEMLAARAWSAVGESSEERLRALASDCEKSGVRLPARVTRDRIDRVDGVLARLASEWRRLVPKGALKLSFDAAAPARGFERLARTESDLHA
jgi:hypothetical protein